MGTGTSPLFSCSSLTILSSYLCQNNQTGWLNATGVSSTYCLSDSSNHPGLSCSGTNLVTSPCGLDTYGNNGGPVKTIAVLDSSYANGYGFCNTNADARGV